MVSHNFQFDSKRSKPHLEISWWCSTADCQSDLVVEEVDDQVQVDRLLPVYVGVTDWQFPARSQVLRNKVYVPTCKHAIQVLLPVTTWIYGCSFKALVIPIIFKVFSTNQNIVVVLLMLLQKLCNTCCGSSWQIYTHIQSFPSRQYLIVVLMLLPQILSHTCYTLGRPRHHFYIGDNFGRTLGQLWAFGQLWHNFWTRYWLLCDYWQILYFCCSFKILVRYLLSLRKTSTSLSYRRQLW